MKTTSKLISTLSAFVASAAMMVESADARKFNASRLQVSIWCNGGSEYGTNSSGGYGCLNDNGWIDCNANGQCEGGRHARRAGNQRSSALPPARKR